MRFAGVKWTRPSAVSIEGLTVAAFAAHIAAADEHAARSARDPKEVAMVIARALEAKRPRFRYPVGPFARINHFLRGKVPSRLIRRGVSRYLGLMKASDAKP